MSTPARQRIGRLAKSASFPVPASVSPGLRRLFEISWSAATSYDAPNWTRENAACGQCAVTALIIQDLFGGQLVRGEGLHGSHYWNRLDDTGDLDLTRTQFPEAYTFFDVQIVDRAYVLSFPDTQRRYGILRDAIGRLLPDASWYRESPSVFSNELVAICR